MSLADSEGITLSGSSSFYSQYASDRAGWTQVPEDFWRWRFNPVVNVYGIPVVASVFVSSEDVTDRQSMNRVYISSSPSASSREESILSFISTIGVGSFNPFFSELTLNAAGISGANVAVQPGNFYLAAAGGRNLRAVEPSGDDPGTYLRNIYAVKTGLGSPFGSHLHLCFLHGRDREGSIQEDSTFRVTPARNMVASLDWGTVFAGGAFRLEGEVAGSMYTRDTRSPGVDTDKVPQWVIDLTGVNVSSSLGWALDLSSVARFSDNMLSLSFRRVDPGYRSMGCPYLRSDRMRLEARGDRYFYGRKLFAGVFYRWDRDNLMNTDRSTYTGNSFGVRAGLAFPDMPRLNISYSPSSLESDDTSGTEVRTSVLSVSTGYRSEVLGHDLNSSISVTVHDNSMGRGSGDYSMVSGALRETLSLDYPVVLTGCVSARRTRVDSEEEWSYMGDLRGTWYPSEELSLTLGGYYSRGEYDRRMGVVTGGGVPLLDWLTMEVSAQYADFVSETESDQSIVTGGAGLTVVW
jgi:hypothetical protein